MMQDLGPAMVDINTFITEIGLDHREVTDVSIDFLQGTPSLPQVRLSVVKLVPHDQLVEALDKARDAYVAKSKS